MTIPSEGRRVQYVGSADGLDLGEVGKLVSAGSSASHVRWNSGGRKGQIDLVHNDDLVPYIASSGVGAEVDDNLETGGLVSVSARQMVDQGGIPVLLDSLVSEGHLSTFGPVVDEAISFVAARLRTDPSMLVVLGELEDDEGEALIYRATRTLLESAFSE